MFWEIFCKKLDIGAGIKFEKKGAINLVQKYVINRRFIHFEHQGPAGRVGCTKHITIIYFKCVLEYCIALNIGGAKIWCKVESFKMAGS